MRTAIRSLCLLLAMLVVTPAAAQLPNIQDKAVWGRIGSPSADGGSGPSQAVPFATLFANVPLNALQLSSLIQIAGGTVLGNNTGSLANVIATAAPLLGIPGTTAGSVCLANLTSGTACINPATGALGTAVATLPAGTYNIVGDSLTQTLTNKTFNCANNICTVRLGSDVTGTLLAANFGALTGDVTNSAGSYATTISAAAVTYAKMQNVTASRLLGNPTGSPASPSEISLGATLAFSGTALQTAALTGDVTASANSFATTIAANAVTNAKLATMAAWTFKANNTSGSATPTDITIDGLTNKASPAAGDEVILWDVAGAAIKKTSVSAIGSAGSVSSIAGNTGAFTLSHGITNSANDIQIDPAYGGRKLLNTLTAAGSATLSDTTSITSSFNEYEIVFENIVPATTGTTCELQIHEGGSFQSAGYKTNVAYFTGSGLVEGSSTTFMFCSGPSRVDNTTPGVSGTLKLYAPTNAAVKHGITGQTTYAQSAAGESAMSSGYFDTAVALDGFQVCFSSSVPTCNVNITSGTIKIYGSK
jgi:hypothetical protein